MDMMRKCSNKLKGSANGSELDRLSSLPDSVLVHILSCLPARDAVKTVVLRAFGDLWTEIDYLDFYWENFSEPADMLDFVRFVGNFLMFHKQPKIRRFRVRFSSSWECEGIKSIIRSDIFNPERDICYGDVNWEKVCNVARDMEMWIKFALRREVEVLEFICCCTTDYYHYDDEFRFPRFVWSSSFLVELNLAHCRIETPKYIQMSSLKVLYLKKVFFSNEEVLSRIIGGCPLLHVLGFDHCYGVSKLSFTAPNVKELKMRFMAEEDHFVPALIVDCPNVRSFVFDGCVDCVKINLPSVKVVSFSLTNPCSYDSENLDEFEDFLDKIGHAEKLTLDHETFAVLTYLVVNYVPKLRNTWKHIVLNTMLNRTYLYGVISLLRKSSYLEELVVHFDDKHDYMYKPGSLMITDQRTQKIGMRNA